MVADNPYNGRWRWWYPAIADWLITNPGGKQEDCAKHLGKHANTVSLIMNSDLFKAYFEERRREYEKGIDHRLRDKMTQVVEASLDNLFKVIDTKREQVPIKMLAEVSTSLLDRLGYAPTSGPTVTIDNSTRQQLVVAPISVNELEEARSVLRAAEAARAAGPRLGAPAVEAELIEGVIEDDEDSSPRIVAS